MTTPQMPSPQPEPVPPETPVAKLGEHGLLAHLSKFVVSRSSEILVGFGDDCAVADYFDAASSHEILTTDMLVEGTHFVRGASTDWQRIGRKAIVANVSDVASMGATPKFILISLGVPKDMTLGEVTGLYAGMAAEASRWGCLLVGGDTVFSPVVVLNISLTALKPKSFPLALRSNCRPGQKLFVSGTLGGSRAGLRLLLDPRFQPFQVAPYTAPLIERHWLPEPRVELGRALVSMGASLAMVDVSDSLYNEVNLLAQASQVGFRIEIARIPAPEALKQFCAITGENLSDYTLFSGEEYELLFATDIDEEHLRSFLEQRQITTPIQCIGTVCEEREVTFVDAQGQPLALEDLTYRHFG